MSISISPKITRSDGQTYELFRNQLRALESSCKGYDDGHDFEVARIALVVRILFHNTKNSVSLLSQVKWLNRKIISSADILTPENLLPQCGLAELYVLLAGAAVWRPFLDSAIMSFESIEDWWDEPVIKDQLNPAFSRKAIILHVANRDGGAHVDPMIDSTFANIDNGAFQMQSSGGQKIESTRKIIGSVVRQIGHEVLKSFRPEFSLSHPNTQQPGFVARGMVVNKGPQCVVVEKRTSYLSSNLTAPCPCGSVRVFSECHKKGAVSWG